MVFAMSGSCSFCGKEVREIFGLAGVTHCNVRVCDECINLCLEIILEETEIREEMAWADSDADPLDERINYPERLARLARRLAANERGTRLINTLAKAIARSADASNVPQRSGFLECSFCGKPQDEATILIAGPTVYICDGCVGDAGDLFMRNGWRPGSLEAT